MKRLSGTSWKSQAELITLRKLSSLPSGTRRRKQLTLIRDFEKQAALTDFSGEAYLAGLLGIIAEDEWNTGIRESAGALGEQISAGPVGLRRPLNELGHAMAVALGRDWADWDASMPGDQNQETYIPVHPLRVYLDGLRSPFNVGSIMRTAMAFGMAQVRVSPDCSPPDHRRAIRSSMGAVDLLPWDICSIEEQGSVPTGRIFALELGGTPVEQFVFPHEGMVILGSEELGVRPELMKLAEKDGGVVSIPLPGIKASLNVGVAFGILMEHWTRSLNQN